MGFKKRIVLVFFFYFLFSSLRLDTKECKWQIYPLNWHQKPRHKTVVCNIEFLLYCKHFEYVCCQSNDWTEYSKYFRTRKSIKIFTHLRRWRWRKKINRWISCLSMCKYFDIKYCYIFHMNDLTQYRAIA